jgi:lipopolysaccharide/colanic/teichoic acid biosynthesis glycosyltransferase
MFEHSSTHSETSSLSRGITRQLSSYPTRQKRIFDILLSLTILPILIPVIAVLYVIVRMDGGPGFFGHRRIGRNGESFKCWKVRTMVTDAQERLDELLATDPVARAEWKRDRKLTNDPRVTRLGNFLRRSSLDELPQIINVLRGEMSLVGPRPVTEPELEMYGARKSAYLKMRPGISGLWQVSGRNDISYSERVQLDWDYANSVSLVLDAKILAKTVDAVLSRTGR